MERDHEVVNTKPLFECNGRSFSKLHIVKSKVMIIFLQERF
jgi:hypothetical protein